MRLYNSTGAQKLAKDCALLTVLLGIRYKHQWKPPGATACNADIGAAPVLILRAQVLCQSLDDIIAEKSQWWLSKDGDFHLAYRFFLLTRGSDSKVVRSFSGDCVSADCTADCIFSWSGG